MPYYPGNSCSFARHFKLEVTIPRVHGYLNPTDYYQIGDRSFYFYVLENFSGNWELETNGDVYLLNWQGYLDAELCYTIFYGEPPDYPI